MKDKINKVVVEQIASLYGNWCVEANLDDEERKLLYDKLFNPEMPTEEDIAKKLYCDVRTVIRKWRKVRNKIYKLLP